MSVFTDLVHMALAGNDCSVREMGRQIGVSPGYANQIAQGTIPSPAVIRRLCRMFSLDETKMQFVALIDKHDDPEDKAFFKACLERLEG